MLNDQALATNQDNYVSAGQLAQTSYVSGSGTDTLWVRVNEGGQWSAWSPGFTVSDPTTIGAGETLELSSLTFRPYQNYYGNPGHILGDFALDYTTAAIP
jgi:hypothetical protein